LGLGAVAILYAAASVAVLRPADAQAAGAQAFNQSRKLALAGVAFWGAVAAAVALWRIRRKVR
ncbi:MAG: hypothetical protein ACRD96_11300, partial [Bryobacteraceae bacterium]